MIGGYDPIAVSDKCRTDFTATEPGGKVYYNKIEFDVVQVQGGVLCTNGKWQAVDGSMSGTTPFRCSSRMACGGARLSTRRLSRKSRERLSGRAATTPPG